jgi:MFS family permease
MLAFVIATVVLSFIPRGTRTVVLAAMLGMATGNGAILLFATGVFQAPITAEFHWTRTQYFAAVQMSIPGTILMAPFIGALLDRIGVRRVVLPSIVLLALLVASLYFLTGSLWHFYTVFALLSILGAGTSSAAYARLMTIWFARKRGLALGAALAGMGIGGAMISPLLQRLDQDYGWRRACLGLAALLLLVTLPAALAWLRDAPQRVGLGVDGEPLAPPGTAAGLDSAAARSSEATFGYTRRETLRQPRFWLMAAIFLILGFAMGGLMFQLFPVLTQRGVAPADAAGIVAGMGLALIAGRAFAGFLMDRFFAPPIAIAFLLGPIAGALLLATGSTGTGAALAGVLVGLAAGAEVDVLAYLVSRYLGMRCYATNYGWLYSAWAAGSGFGPLLAAAIFDRTGRYEPALFTYAAMFAIVCILMTRLGPYPTWHERWLQNQND